VIEENSIVGAPPTPRNAPAATDPVSVDLSRVKGRAILVVDDEEDIRRLLKRALEEKGFRVLEADRGSTALSMVKQHVPDAIVLDAMLPELHGFDICRRIKASARYGHIPILMISAVYRGWRFAEDLKQSYGVNAFLEKPFRLGDVFSKLESLLAGAPRADSRDPESLTAEAEKALAAGMAAYKDGDIDRAVGHLERGIALDPLSYRLHYHLALLVGRKGDVFRAIQELETAINLNPRSFAALKNLAVLYERAGFKNKAIEMWERAIGYSPDDPTRGQIKEHLMSLL
jgi:DNA-binding response OmpR family regulator